MALGIQHAWAYAILSTVDCLALPYFSTLSLFLEKIYEELNLCLDFLYNVCLKFLLFSEELSEIDQKVYLSSYKIPVILVRF